MEYRIGTIVILKDGKSVYITAYDKETGKYKGFEADNNESQEDIVFFASDVVMRV